jgi:SAM-dependent methyltransferase
MKIAASASSLDTWEQGDPYDQYVGRWSRQVAPAFLSWLGVPPGCRWLDVGCGTGALLSTVLERCAPSELSGVDPSEGFLHTAARRIAGRATLHRGSAEQIPLPADAVDVSVCGLVLNFVPNPAAGLAEMARVTRQGGTVAAYVWDYAGKMDLMRYFWASAASLDATAAELDEGVRFPLCEPLALQQLFESSGLRAVQVTGIEIPTPFANFDDYWQPFLGGQGPAPAYAKALESTARDRLRESLRQRLPAGRDGTIALVARAWAVRGTVSAGSNRR